jgi:hypothetical protein
MQEKTHFTMFKAIARDYIYSRSVASLIAGVIDKNESRLSFIPFWP